MAILKDFYPADIKGINTSEQAMLMLNLPNTILYEADNINKLIAKINNKDMALPRKKAEEKIFALSVPIINHLVKILKWKDKQNYNKHLKDITKWLLFVQNITLKSKNSRISEKDYYSWLYDQLIGDNQKVLDTIIEKSLADYHNLQEIRTNKEVMYELRKIMKIVSKHLSMNTFSDIRNYLNLKDI